jgi:hypothetical protein
MKTNRLRATTGYELQPRCGFFVHDQRNSQRTFKASHPDAGREHFLNRLEIKEMNEIDVVEAVQDASLDD